MIDGDIMRGTGSQRISVYSDYLMNVITNNSNNSVSFSEIYDLAISNIRSSEVLSWGCFGPRFCYS